MGAAPLPGGRSPRVVAFGGGHGLAAALAAWRQLTPEVTAVVTVADDGGSSGRIRRELPVLPPGDLRMALTALAGPGEREQGLAALLQQHNDIFDEPQGLLPARPCDHCIHLLPDTAARMPLPILATRSSSQRWGAGSRRLYGISNRRAVAYWKDHGP